jgi:hypothetical protein
MNTCGLYIGGGEGFSLPAAEQLIFPSHLGVARPAGTGFRGQSEQVGAASRTGLVWQVIPGL